jgi:hypothetical protein
VEVRDQVGLLLACLGVSVGGLIGCVELWGVWVV